MDGEADMFADERITLKDLILRDRIAQGGGTLKDVIMDLERSVLSNAGVDVFEETFKLLFIKIFDEHESRKDREAAERFAGSSGNLRERIAGMDDSGFREMEFRIHSADSATKAGIEGLFERAKAKWPGAFAPDSRLEFRENHLAACVARLQDVRILDSDLLLVDEAFEHLVNKSTKGGHGQFFTPRHVIDMCVKMLNPRPGESMIDTAAGSGGFPAHTIFSLTGRMFGGELPKKDRKHALRVFGIEFDDRIARVARTLNMVACGGTSNILCLDSLDWTHWGTKAVDPEWKKAHGEGFARLMKMKARDDDGGMRFNFDMLMANPPFGGVISDRGLLDLYDMGTGQNRASREILFIERNLEFLAPGGRMAIVLPHGIFTNSTDSPIRKFIASKCRVIAVIGLDRNTFLPHTSVRTSVLIVQKWNRWALDGGPPMSDYPVFLAESEHCGKDSAGKTIHAHNADGSLRRDQFGRPVPFHDLHDHGGVLGPGIAEEFSAWAVRNGLGWAE